MTSRAVATPSAFITGRPVSGAHRVDAIGRFAAVKLDHAEAHMIEHRVQVGIGGIDEQADRRNAARHEGRQFRRLIGVDEARRGAEEHEADEGRTERPPPPSRPRASREAADFDRDFHDAAMRAGAISGGDARGGGGRIGGGRDRPADDEIVGAGTQSIFGRHDTLLIVRARPGGTHARRDEQEIGPEIGAQHGGFLRAADDAVKAGALRQRGQAPHLIEHRRRLRRSRQDRSSSKLVSTVTAITSGRGTDEFMGGVVGGLHRGFHHRAASAGVDIDHVNAELADRAHRAGHGIGNVVELEIEKDRQVGGASAPPARPWGRGL